jgi:hypothetical protein
VDLAVESLCSRTHTKVMQAARATYLASAAMPATPAELTPKAERRSRRNTGILTTSRAACRVNFWKGLRFSPICRLSERELQGRALVHNAGRPRRSEGPPVVIDAAVVIAGGVVVMIACGRSTLPVVPLCRRRCGLATSGKSAAHFRLSRPDQRGASRSSRVLGPGCDGRAVLQYVSAYGRTAWCGR